MDILKHNGVIVVNIDSVTWQDILEHKTLSYPQLMVDLGNLKRSKSKQNTGSFYGNPVLYHYQLKNLLNCRRQNSPTLKELWDDPDERSKLLKQTAQLGRKGPSPAGNIFEAFRINRGSIVMFKASVAKHVYDYCRSKSVVDPCAGWGGRMLGAWAMGIDYTGIDTNINLKSAYEDMMLLLDDYDDLGELFVVPRGKLKMLWQDALKVDYSEIEYDTILTSPPYVNLEVYEHMTEWRAKKDFYCDFLLPLWHKTWDNLPKGGHSCWNISPTMFDDVMKLGMISPTDEIDLVQQLGDAHKRQDKIYIWKK